jgi:cytochrome c-type biogenesis protein CcmF
LTWGGPVLAPFGLGLGVFVIAGALTDIVERAGFFRAPFSVAARRALGLPRSTWGTAVAHAGLGLTLIGIVAESTWSDERILSMKQGDRATVGGYAARLDGFTQSRGSNFDELAARFSITLGDRAIGTMEPSKRNFSTRSMGTTEAALMTRGLSQLYISLGDVNADGSVAVRAYYKPLVLLIWLGTVVMVIGGGLSLMDRRLRVGAPKPARPAKKLQAAE